jgi:hypothetical protein
MPNLTDSIKKPADSRKWRGFLHYNSVQHGGPLPVGEFQFELASRGIYFFRHESKAFFRWLRQED